MSSFLFFPSYFSLDSRSHLVCTYSHDFVFENRDALKQFPLDASAQDADDEEQDGSGDDAEPGCCLLCERLMPLTRHHVIPRYLVSARLHTSEETTIENVCSFVRGAVMIRTHE